MMKIFEFASYKDFVRERIGSMPNHGRGQYRELSRELRMHTSLVSQVFGGDRHLTAEQACDLCQLWGLNEMETEMFLALLNYERAGSKNLKRVLDKQIERLKKRADKLIYRLPQEKILSQETQSIFYSHWYYSGIRLLTSISEYQSIDSIAEYFSLPKSLVSQVVEFLLSNGLCILDKSGKIQMGPQRTHLSSDSPLVSRHHVNWRLKGLAKTESLREHEMMFTAPLSIAKKDAIKVRKKILELIEEMSGFIKQSKAEKVMFLNIDWLDF